MTQGDAGMMPLWSLGAGAGLFRIARAAVDLPARKYVSGRRDWPARPFSC